MEGTKNINKKLRIPIFTILFLIGFIYSVYSQTTSGQNNAVSSLESNLIIQELINSSFNGYSTAGQYLANFLSINGVPSYVWTIVIFLITTLFFIAIYTYLFEIFIQRAKITESETMRKSKILFVFALSAFSAIAIGYAIPFLLNLYGFILLILVLIALFFFGRATISYGKSFHYAAKSFVANVEKELLKVEGELKKARKDLSEQDIKYLEEGREKIDNDIENINNQLSNANAKFETTLSELENAYRAFINNFINRCEIYFNQLQNQNLLSPEQIKEKDEFINTLIKIRGRMHKSEILDTEKSTKDLYEEIQKIIDNLKYLASHKSKLENLLHYSYIFIFHSQGGPYSQIFKDIQDTINEYRKVETLLMRFDEFEDAFKRNIELRLRHIFNDPDNRKYEIGIFSALNKSKNYIRELKNLVNRRIQFLEKLLH